MWHAVITICMMISRLLYHKNCKFVCSFSVYLFLWALPDINKDWNWKQTTNDKWKYKLQQLFKMLSLALTQAWSHFLHWSMALSTMVSLQSAETLTSHCFSSARSRVARSSMVRCCHGNHAVGTQPISSFSNAINPQLNVDAFCEKKSFIDEVIPICFSGPVF